MAPDGCICQGVGGDPATLTVPGQGWGCDGWDPVYLLGSTDPSCLVSPPPELICSKENKEFHYILSMTHSYLQLTFFEGFLYARLLYALPFLYVISSVEADFLIMCECYDLNI